MADQKENKQEIVKPEPVVEPTKVVKVKDKFKKTEEIVMDHLFLDDSQMKGIKSEEVKKIYKALKDKIQLRVNNEQSNLSVCAELLKELEMDRNKDIDIPKATTIIETVLSETRGKTLGIIMLIYKIIAIMYEMKEHIFLKEDIKLQLQSEQLYTFGEFAKKNTSRNVEENIILEMEDMKIKYKDAIKSGNKERINETTYRYMHAAYEYLRQYIHLLVDSVVEKYNKKLFGFRDKENFLFENDTINAQRSGRDTRYIVDIIGQLCKISLKDKRIGGLLIKLFGRNDKYGHEKQYSDKMGQDNEVCFTEILSLNYDNVYAMHANKAIADAQYDADRLTKNLTK